MKFCVTTYATQGIILPELLIPKLAEWGFDGVELWGGRTFQLGEPLWGLEGRKADEILVLKKLADENGLEIPAISTYFKFTVPEAYQESLKNGQRYCDLASTLGAKIIRVVGEGIPSSNMTEDLWKTFISGLRDLANLGEKYGITFALELHKNTPHDTVLGQLRCIWQTNSPFIRSLYQPTTLIETDSEVDVLWALDKLYPYIVHVHIASSIPFKDGVLASRGKGRHVHWSQIFEELRNRGYRGYVSIEGIPGRRLEALGDTIQWLRSFL
ncbi:MAG: sugar phosphate isomerase/epimerase family protein [Candidatus Bathyarchaeia archaeon]